MVDPVKTKPIYVVMCGVAVCYPQTWKCLAADPFVEVGVSLLGSSLPAGMLGLLLYSVGLENPEVVFRVSRQVHPAD